MPLLVLLIFVYNMPQALPSFAPVLNDPSGRPAGDGPQRSGLYRRDPPRRVALHPRGQSEAARALGLRYAGIQWRVIIPQALRVALPALAMNISPS
ncbi:amino acid ABC transporter, permease/ATP-binding protein, His/Glu/Gln/Arg/opine family [Klebsiella variicola]|uniref:Amino acid ABC transporter, permease/ATP-binding protein, His/Glu/Gln/Arg/opine family n=1 Tax=Klebsiella variicola TaxID=244366 RepID=A0A7H4MJ32_KLEVA|nr:amino acid ABC transporter, permease/ATP-binding protein, His/Glu/Gln/Arg/opine family [Klebsiella variicola]